MIGASARAATKWERLCAPARSPYGGGMLAHLSCWWPADPAATFRA
ncbi:hypothetical protein GA0070614_1213 [Micromonospora coxensis]|uniref:Uncharacterized protein n=1 Tax=Micromonospora coxensis TaxID=356852 RepID=A0A1C5HEK9_9ACTN|nr:hypothetical protein GA0070614_1213 [Micromonospora coxensis]